ncbi:hypothetical protein GM921_12665 [Pedobacter sp. LMG 31464]|uniref:Uncharacterized protein n=1 Tax=Pedobacter planticolens TaxID=2679964 RepID=A0A923DYE7_9SPHI|nr:hypothetical protein [Pedobacter planticolens]MBB2146346.1 hypothetical protein [Pedobacter planticolens]
MKKVLLVASLIFPLFAFAQRDLTMNQMFLARGLAVPGDIVGRTDVVGYEFLDDNWSDAIVQTQKGEIYKDIKVKYSVLEDLLYFLGEKDAVMKFIVPIKEFSLLPTTGSPKVFRSGFPKISDYNEASFYQVLTEGKVMLLKKTSKRITDRREYNSAVTTKEFIGNTKYFLYQDGKMIELKKDKSFILSYLGKKEEMQKFIASNKADVKNEVHLIALFNFYNSL